jgi:MtN3 and saliva related transmembrane protein
MVEMVGYLAALLTTLSFIPQVVKSWRSKSVGDFSLGTLCAFTSGVLLWLVYGVSLGSPPVIAANATTLLLSGVLLWLKLQDTSSSI